MVKKGYKKCTRGKRKSVRSVEKTLIIGGLNPDGATSKITTIRKTIIETNASIWVMQETKAQPGAIRFEGFVTFEHNRILKDGGGLSISVKKELNPCYLRDGGEQVEALTVRIHLKKIIISLNTAYGPQEYANIKKKTMFWKYLDEEYNQAKKEGHGFLLQGDLNSRLGPKYISSDKKDPNENGKMFAQFVESNKLTIVNSLDICKGSTTWAKIRNGKKLKSTIDFFVVCERMLPYVKQMVIDNHKNHKIAHFHNVKKGGKPIDSDHFPMWLEIELKVSPEKPEKTEIQNFKDTEGQKKFKTNTNETHEFTTCTESDGNFTLKTDKWKQLLNEHCRKAFKKIRIRKQNMKPSKANQLINERSKLAKTKTDEELKELDSKIADIISEEEREKVMKFQKFTNQNGSVNLPEMWKLKKKLWPKKASSIPTAKINHKGKLVPTSEEVKSALKKEYTERLRKRPEHPKVSKHYKKKTIEMKLKSSKENKSTPFEMPELEIVLNKLKVGKARDPEGWAR